MPDMSTYRKILAAIAELERINSIQEENALKYIIIVFAFSFLALVVYCLYTADLGYLTSPDIIGVALVPAFSFLYSSYINERRGTLKTEIYHSLLRLYEEGKIDDVSYDIDQVKAIINSILTARVNGK